MSPAPAGYVPPALVVLAGGASARLGACKALVRLGAGAATTPLALLLDAGAALLGGRPLVVTGAAHAEIEAAVDELGLDAWHTPTLAFNARWVEGRAGSVLCARDARPGRDLCIAPVDVPLVTAQTFRVLAGAWRAAGAPPRGWLAPRTPDGRGGHPVVIGRELLSAWTPASLDEPLRGLRERAQETLAVEVDDLAILDDLDTPDDLARLRARRAV